MKHVTRTISIIFTFSNFLEIFFCKLFKRPISRFKLWGGTVFNVSNANSNLYTILEVWRERVYGGLGEIIKTKNPIVIDIGANIGAFSIFAYKINKECRVFAFEPERSNYKLLIRNIEANGLQNKIFTFEKAVFGSRGIRKLNVLHEGSGKNSMVYDLGNGTTEDVMCVTLEDIFVENDLGGCDLLKIDCEGSEYDLLLNTPREVFKKIKIIFLELHQAPGHTHDELKDFLKSMGYSIRESRRGQGITIATLNV